MHHDSGDRSAKGKPRQHAAGSGEPSPLDAVRQLLSEKARFEKWLTDLDAKRATTPAHVFERVKSDYAGRLQGVLEKLASHTTAMQEHATELAAKLEQLSASEQDILDSRAESELRAEVGELSAGDWDKLSKKLERDLAKIKQDQGLIESDFNDLRALLSESAGRAATADSAESTAASDASASEPAREDATSQRPSSEQNVDELAFLKSVIGTTSPTPAPSRPRAAADATPAPPAASASVARPVEKPPAEKPPAEKLVETPEPGPVIRSKGGDEPLAMHVTGANPIVLRSSGVVEQPKTLKCGECGSMNYASEWYCERCGAELTSV